MFDVAIYIFLWHIQLFYEMWNLEWIYFMCFHLRCLRVMQVQTCNWSCLHIISFTILLYNASEYIYVKLGI